MNTKGMSIEEIENSKREIISLVERYTRILEATRSLREKIAAWQKEHGIQPEDSTETLRRLREEDDCSPIH